MASMAGETIAMINQSDDNPPCFLPVPAPSLIQDPANGFVDHRDLSRTAFDISS